MVSITKIVRSVNCLHKMSSMRCPCHMGKFQIRRSKQINKTFIHTSSRCHSGAVDGNERDDYFESLSENEKNRLKFIKQEFANLQTMDMMIPQYLSSNDWRTLMKLSSQQDRQKYIKHIFYNTKARPAKKDDGVIYDPKANIEPANKTAPTSNNGLEANMDLQTLLVRTQSVKNKPNLHNTTQSPMESGTNDLIQNCFIYNSNDLEERFIRDRAYMAWKFGKPVIFDLSYRQMSGYSHTLGKELLKCYNTNLKHQEPFQFHFTDLKENSESDLDIKSTFNNSHLVSFHNESFMDLFPPKKLIYLSPYARENFLDEEGQIFVIGGLLDTYDEAAPSLVRAKKLGVKVAALPLGEVIRASISSRKALPLQSVLQILLDMNITRNRDNVRKFIPRNYFKGIRKGW